MQSSDTLHPDAAPFDLFILKVASRCNLACGYCYEYFHGDASWKAQPRAMSQETLVSVARRITEHAGAHRLPSVSISLHGGEPLSVGLPRLTAYVETLRTHLHGVCELHIGMQSNGTLYTEAVHEWALDMDVKVGISLDGPPSSNDSRRPFHSGRASTPAVERALGLLEGSPIFAGILAVIDIAADPVTTLRYLGQWNPPTLDFLLPHASWVNPPFGRSPDPTGEPVYGRWLAAVFNEWWHTPLSAIAIRTFEEIILRLAGRVGKLETLGTEPVTLITVGTDGSYEGVDTLKSAFPGAQHLGLKVGPHSLDDVLRHPHVTGRQSGTAALSTTCQSCAHLRVCGGGYLPHRFGPDDSFRHPSVYCTDLSYVIQHITATIRNPACSSA